MKTILIGDPCAGKSTIIEQLEKEKYCVAIEDGIKKIPPLIEAEKLNSNFWFMDYYFKRDFPLKNKKAVHERYLHFQFPFTNAQAKFGKITPKEHIYITERLQRLADQLPLEKESIVIHMICSNEQIQARLTKRNLHKKQDRYWDILREETENFFKPRTKYYKIDTTPLSPQEVYAEVKKIFAENSVTPP